MGKYSCVCCGSNAANAVSGFAAGSGCTAGTGGSCGGIIAGVIVGCGGDIAFLNRGSAVFALSGAGT